MDFSKRIEELKQDAEKEYLKAMGELGIPLSDKMAHIYKTAYLAGRFTNCEFDAKCKHEAQQAKIDSLQRQVKNLVKQLSLIDPAKRESREKEFFN